MCVCVLFRFLFCSVLFVIQEGKGMMLFCCCFVDVRIFIFNVLFFSFFFSCLYRDRPYSSAQPVSVCVCVLFPFLFCSVLFVIKEGKGMMLFSCCFVDVRILIVNVLFLSFFCSCLYRDRPFFNADGKFVFLCFISISFWFGLVCNKRREGYDVILLLFLLRSEY